VIRVLLGDDFPKRRQAICDAVEAIWKGEVVCVDKRDDILPAYQAAKDDSGRAFGTVIIAFGFSNRNHASLFRDLAAERIQRVLLVHRETPRPTDAPPIHVLVVPREVAPTDGELIQALEPILGPQPRKSLQVNYDPGDARLVEHLRWLDAMGKESRSIEILGCLAIQLLPADVTEVRLFPLSQGFSGARVFKIAYDIPGSTAKDREWVLKLTPIARFQSWKCHNELHNFAAIDRSLQDNSPLPMLPRIHGVVGRTGPFPEAARFGDWLAVAYELLGAGVWETTDLETAYLQTSDVQRPAGESAVSVPQDQDFVYWLLERVIPRLKTWHLSHSKCRAKSLWSFETTPEDGVAVYPPYCFRAWERSRIFGLLSALQDRGRSLRGDDAWKREHEAVMQCLYPDHGWRQRAPRLFDLSCHVVLGPCHGDLNASNILLLLNPPSPLLIDFACYQEEGHVLQDYARLEVAVKFELMGREGENTVPAKDLDCSALDAWIAAEDYLSDTMNSLSASGSVSAVATESADDSCVRGRNLCQWIRQKAWQEHRECDHRDGTLVRGDFCYAYQAALLFHTIRCIGYESIPHVKRILAVYSAGRLVNSLSYADSRPSSRE
jgi:hypothetical protein